MFERRNIGLNVVLSIITCGIYAIYWFYQIAQDFENTQTPGKVNMSAGMIILLDILTCGIYGYYVYYKWGAQTPEVFALYGRQKEDKSILYLLLSIFGLGIVNICLIQNDLNELADAGGMPPPPPYGGQPPYGAAPYAPPPPAPGFDVGQPPVAPGYTAPPAGNPAQQGFAPPPPAQGDFNPAPPPGSPYTDGQPAPASEAPQQPDGENNNV